MNTCDAGRAIRASLEIGTRVKVCRDALAFGLGSPRSEPLGKIAGPPQEVHGADGFLTTYWVEFDEPQLDPDSDGPFARSRVLEKYLEAIDS